LTDTLPIYSSRITKTYLEYLKTSYPDLDIDAVLEYAEMAKYEVEDPAHWFSQHQVDRFQEALLENTGNPNIPREAGRYTTSHKGMGPLKQYTLGFLNLSTVYLLLGKASPIMSRGATVKANKLGSAKVEIVSTPNLGVNEKPFQCENRIGVIESLAKLFTNRFADVEHPFCFHKGNDCCRYIITWGETPFLIWKRIRNYFMLISILISLGLFFVLPLQSWGVLVLFCSFISITLALIAEYIEKKALVKTVKTQGSVANDLINEINIRHNNTLLIQNIGQTTSSIIGIDDLIKTVTSIMELHMDFDRGLIMLVNDNKTRLLHRAGYGYDKEKEALLLQTEFNLDNPESRGTFIDAFRDQKPILVNDIAEIENLISKRSLTFAKKMGVHSFICVPIIYENESLGIMAVDNIKSKRSLTKSDMNLLMGVASQTAAGIVNAMSFHKVQESEKKYRELVENANSIIMRREIKGNITFFNEFAQKFFGYTENEILGLQQHPERPIIIESENVLKSGKKVFIAWAHKPIYDRNGKFSEILCIGNDITELKKAEIEKRDLETRLQRARKMEAIGTLAGGVAHDLNNILSGIVSYPGLLLMDISQDSPLRKPLLTIQKSGERAAAIVQDLLTLARRGVVVTEIVNINSIVYEYLKSPEYENLQINHPEVRVKTNLDTNLLNILGSPVHLSKTIMNLVSNAAEAISDSGEIFISTENQYIDTSINSFDEVKEGDYVTLIVRDTGIGISSQNLERIFEPFYTKKVMGKSGTGLGMAVVWGTVKDHKGYIDVESTEDQGSKFTLYFPAVRQELPSEKSVLSFEDFMGKGESILIVDDVEDQREIVSAMLKKLGYHVATVSSGEEAVEFMKNNSADLLLLDMIMEPGIDGLDTYKKIIELNPGQKAIIVSGFSETERVKEARRLGVRSYIQKPYLIETIGQAVRAELDK